jgi:hypothetical protein
MKKLKKIVSQLSYETYFDQSSLKFSNILIFSIQTFILSQTPNSVKARQTKTSRPDNLIDKCHFFFNLYYSPHHQRWFIPREGDGNCCHCGHIALDQDVVRLSMSNLDPTILKQVLSQLELNISPAAIRAMFNA